MIKGIFFDFNGVIIDDEPIQMTAYQELLAPHGIELAESHYYAALGMDDVTFVRAQFERSGKKLTDEMLTKLQADKVVRHRQLIEAELPLFPGVVTFLKASARHHSLALVSMANLEEIDHVLNRADLRKLFSVIVSSDDVSVCKPAPDCYLKALENLNEKRRGERLLPLLARECLVIEDSPPGIQSGKQAGMHALGVTNTVSDSQLRAVGAEVVIASFADLTVDAVHHLFD